MVHYLEVLMLLTRDLCYMRVYIMGAPILLVYVLPIYCSVILRCTRAFGNVRLLVKPTITYEGYLHSLNEIKYF